jgi:DNA-binding CsgD family transcriptional regulator
VAHDLLTQIGNLDFVERARRELVLSGVPTRRPEPTVRASLTAQEAQIARLAAAGMTNPEIGAQLFISSHTVEWHLRKVFAKLGIRSRRDINRVLPQETQARSAARAARPAST